MASFYKWGSIASRLEPLPEGSLVFTKLPRSRWYSFYQPWKNERLSQPWSCPVVFNTNPSIGTQDLNQQATEATEEATKIAAKSIYLSLSIYLYR